MDMIWRVFISEHEIVRLLNEISKECDKIKKCDDCLFYNNETGECAIGDIPSNWKIKEVKI